MESSSFKRLKKAFSEYFPDGKYNDYQLRHILTKLGGRNPEALCAMIARTQPLYTIQGYLGRRLEHDSFWADFEESWSCLPGLAAINSELDVNNFKMFLDMGIPPLEIIQYKDKDISPLYRYLIAANMGFYSELKKLKPEAEQQLRENPFYFDHYKEHQINFPITKEALNG